MAETDTIAGLYPDPDDPTFAARLYQKREFHEARALVARVADGSLDPCTSEVEAVFELTPVQRIVSRFLHPLTPYMGLLLYHGVGVGKTCSAVTIAEQFLETSSTKVIVLVPQALQDNFKRTVCDTSKLVWTEGTWKSRQCTGTSYVERLGLMDNPDARVVASKIEESKRTRYSVMGYQAFANLISKTLSRRVPAGLTDPVARQSAENEVLRRLFSDHLIIVDEAHNLRDLAAGEGPPDSIASDENQGGKALNPFLRRIVLHAEGLRLVLMSATPMYNSAPEIVLLLNYLLMNDSKSEKSALRSTDLFTKDGELIPGESQHALERAARRYVSYMRGENPYTFPLRMHPLAATRNPASMWPTISATKRPVQLTGPDSAALNALPIVFTEPVTGSPVERMLRGSTKGGQATEEGVVDSMLDTRMQMANLTYPNEMFGISGFDFYFSKQTGSSGGHKLRLFSPKEMDIDDVFTGEGLRNHAPKIHRVVESVTKARGISFVYSRYIKSGALPTAIALERAGFQRRLADGKLAPLLTGVAARPPICAICGSTHTGETDHPFHPACYILLTSDDDISPNFAGLVRQATTWNDSEYGPLGSHVKVVLGSQVASEGLDLKCIREMHILDSWYHLNRTDQIIGRAIRYCSHTALRSVEQREGLTPMALNNCLIYMHCLIVPETEYGPALETADMYAYRVAIAKAQMVGKVQRLLKKHAWDCNLELEAITFVGLPPRVQIDAQGAERRSLADDGTEMDGYSINDQDYTTVCDYQVCSHECAVAITDMKIDESTFSYTDARQLVIAKQNRVRHLFDEQIMVGENIVQEIFSDLPWEIASEALIELIDSRRFKFTRPDGVTGYLVAKAGYLVFQPIHVTDTEIPMSLRYARGFQLRRHFMEPRMPVWGRAEEAGPVVQAEEDVFGPWNAWVSYVEGGSNLPPHMPRLWSWILERYSAIPEVRTIALQWWIEKHASYTQQRALIESGLADPTEILIHGILKKHIQQRASGVTYRILIPDENRVEFFCKKSTESKFTPCASTFAAVVDKAMGNTPVRIPEDSGSLVGYITPKGGKFIYKIVWASKIKPKAPGKKAVASAMRSVGAECGNASNKPDHLKRVRALQEAGRESDLKPFMLPDADESWDPTGAKERSDTPEHMNDLTHAPLCLYMEFLTRLFDARRLGGKRWFLNAVEASQTNMMVKQA